MRLEKLVRDLESRVDAVVRKTRAELPEDLRKLAEGVPVFCE